MVRSVRPPYFEQTLRVIYALRSLPSIGRVETGIGYTAHEVYTAYSELYPSFPLSVQDINTLLQQGAKRGVFNLGGCSTGANSIIAGCTNQPRTTLNAPDFQLYYVNHSMASSNPQNRAFAVAAAAAMSREHTRLGYLPCSASIGAYIGGGAKGSDPYASAGSNSALGVASGGVVSFGANNGTALNAAPIACGTAI